MAERKPISKKMRFEVFKRDAFTCQYCGRSAPEAILEVDHIVPVAEGGKNTLINLVTSCMDCNRGKGKRRLSDTKEIDLQKDELKALNEKREQTEMMIKWRKELMQIEEEQINTLQYMIWSIDDIDLKEWQKVKARKLIHQFGFPEVCDALDIAIDQYMDGSYYSVRVIFEKLGGICYNRRKRREEERMK